MATMLLLMFTGAGCSPSDKAEPAVVSTAAQQESSSHATTEDNILDPWLQRLTALSHDKTPLDPAESSFGLDPDTGLFNHPAMTRDSHEAHPFEGTLDYWDTNDYASNMTVEAYFPITV